MYAVVNYKGRQYKVSEGDELLLDKVDTQGKKLELSDVAMIVEGEKVVVGRPTVGGAKVTLEVLGQEKGEKVQVVKYKAKSRYRRKTGFRPQYTRVRVEKITAE